MISVNQPGKFPLFYNSQTMQKICPKKEQYLKVRAQKPLKQNKQHKKQINSMKDTVNCIQIKIHSVKP